MQNDHDTDRRWTQLAAELRAYKRSHSDVWGSASEIAIMRYLGGNSSPEETRLVEQALQQRPSARLSLETMREIMEFPGLIDSPSDTAMSGDFEQSRLELEESMRIAIDSSIQLSTVALEDELVSSLSDALSAPPTDRVKAIGIAISDFDPLYVIAAGEDEEEEIGATSPIWFTHLLQAPDMICWPSRVNTGSWNVRLWTAEKGNLLSLEVSKSEVLFDHEIQQRLPIDEDVHWEIHRPGESGRMTPFVQGVFVLKGRETAERVRTELDELDGLPAGIQRDLRIASCYDENYLYDSLIGHLLGLQDTYFKGAAGFLTNRALSAVYVAIQRELSKRWMGDPEGLWATLTANQYLESGYRLIGITYEE